MQMREAMEEYRYATLDHAPKTQTMRTQRLGEFALWCEKAGVALNTIKPGDVGKFLEEVRTRRNPQTGKPLSSYTVHGYAATVKAFLNWAAKEELIPLSLPRRLAMPRIETKVIEAFTDDQVRALFKACEKERNTTLEVRDRALLSVLLDTGIRAGDGVALHLRVSTIIKRSRSMWCQPGLKKVGSWTHSCLRSF